MRGFTVIELLVVISIIALLSSVAISAATIARTKAKEGRARTEIGQLVRAILIAQGEQSQPLRGISGTVNPITTANNTGTISGTPCLTTISTAGCQTRWDTALANIQTATNGTFTNAASFTKDPWNNPYVLVEREGVGAVGNDPLSCAVKDTLSSYGNSSDPGDDITFSIPLSGYCQ